MVFLRKRWAFVVLFAFAVGCAPELHPFSAACEEASAHLETCAGQGLRECDDVIAEQVRGMSCQDIADIVDPSKTDAVCPTWLLWLCEARRNMDAGTIDAADAGAMECVDGDVERSRRRRGGAGCSRGIKWQDNTCVDGSYRWVDRSDFDGSRRRCEPGEVDTSGAMCDASSCECSDECAWEPVENGCAETRTIFVHFDGVTLNDCPGGCDEPEQDRTWIVGHEYGGSARSWDFEAFGRGRSSRDAILNKLSGYFSRYCVDVVDRRPESGDYTMVVISDSIVLPNHGVCALDCTDRQERVCIVNKIADDTIDTIARYTAHELGHSYGLGHTGNRADIMHTISLGSRFAVSSAGETSCGRARGEEQNSPAILSEHLGLRTADGVGVTCHVDGVRGRCIDTSAGTCGGTTHTGACPGAASIRCCTL